MNPHSLWQLLPLTLWQRFVSMWRQDGDCAVLLFCLDVFARGVHGASPDRSLDLAGSLSLGVGLEGMKECR
ncbi:MAG: hypothetical protein LC772_05300, partial [Chloroflexi bacterium]|nr:hypothetical protein [Chloroflexota bacterium]